jgi:hypothetical protein
MLFPLVLLHTGGTEASQGPLLSVEATLRLFLREQEQHFAADVIKAFLSTDLGPSLGYVFFFVPICEFNFTFGRLPRYYFLTLGDEQPPIDFIN